jgi:hypothetical protein
MQAGPSAGAAPSRRVTLLHLALLASVTVLAYLPSLGVPFYLDDFSSIRDNPLIFDWRGFAALRAYAPMRWITYLTFLFNYHTDHFDPFGYHVVNLTIHVLAGFAVYALALALLGTP